MAFTPAARTAVKENFRLWFGRTHLLGVEMAGKQMTDANNIQIGIAVADRH